MRVLIGDITGGALKAGEKLPSVRKLAVQFDVSTGVVRECQLALVERGLLDVRHGRAAKVNPETEWDVLDPEVLAAVMRGEGAERLLGEYLESRRILEVEAAGLAAERANPEMVEQLTQAFEAMQQAARHAHDNSAAEPLYEQADVNFHRAIIAAAGNRPLARLAEPIHSALSATFPALARPQKRLSQGLPEHRRILDAIAAGDADAARRAMREHLLTIEGHLRERAPVAG
jgi:DNA-binding FadR family transcriptional regulator